MQALRIRKRLDSDTIQFPELKNMIGKDVEIIIIIETQETDEKTPINPARTPGSAKGMMKIADDFEMPLASEILEDFYK